LQSFYYRLTIRAGSPRPQPGQPLYAYHRRRIHIFVLSLYLVYTFVQTLYDLRLAGDFYTDLGVTPASPDREVKARFRRLAAKLHPDKIQQTNGPESVVTEGAFVHLKLAQDTILDPAKRFAYDRFGPGIVRVQQPGLKTIKDYVVYAGLRSLVPEYAKGALALVVLNYFWLPKWGQYWRYLAVLSIVFLELYFLTHTWEPPAFSVSAARAAHALLPDIFPAHLLPFQLLTLARRMSMSLNIFISQLAPPAVRSQAEQDRHTQQHISHLNQVAMRTDAEAGGLLNLGLAPFRGDRDKVEVLRRGMKEGIIMSAVRNSPEVKEAVRKVIERRRHEPEIQDIG
jgi:hypothetical protein